MKLFNDIKYFFLQLYTNRSLLYELTKRDFTSKYIKNYFGLAWAILDPLFFIVVLYFVFSYRFNTADFLGVPFVVYLITGYIAYDVFNQALLSVSTSIANYSFLVKKVNFHSALIPLVKLISSYLMHLIILGIVIIILLINGIMPTWSWFQLIYYHIALMAFLLGAGWFISSIYLFFQDIKNIVGIITRLMFFLTPIFWSLDGLPPKYVIILKINPIVYIVEGYRNSFLFSKPFWEDPGYTIYFWCWVLVLFGLGITTYKRLRPHFSDVI